MVHGDRISALDASFLELEKGGERLHVASVTILDGPAPSSDDLHEHVAARLHLAPRFRRRIAEIPFGRGRPVWVDDPHFNLSYHLRHAGLPAPGSDVQLEDLVARLIAQPLDRTKPLWELWLVEGLPEGRFALVAKSHHALVDGELSVDITRVLFDATVDAQPSAPSPSWTARPLPTSAQLLSDALVEAATHPRELASALLRRPRRLLDEARDRLQASGALAFAGLDPTPPTPLSVRVGPHRRYTRVDAELAELKRVKASLGGTVNDAILAAVAGALGRWLRRRAVDTRDLVLTALVPTSVRADDAEQGSVVAPLTVPLPVGIEDALDRYRAVRDVASVARRTHEPIDARTLTELAGFASPTLASQAARLQRGQRAVDLVVTNVPGPQSPRYLLGRRLRAVYPVVPIGGRQALGIAVMSYDGRLGFGLLADYDAIADLDVLASELRAAIAELASAASTPRRAARGRRKAAAHEGATR